jgi:hypothetical protein
MKGRRLPVVDGKPTMPFEPGDYCGPFYGYTGDKPSVFFLKPNARDVVASPIARAVQHVTSPPHTFRECADGSLEIRPSLGDNHDGVSDGWHGYLDEGHIWRRA